MILNRNYNHQTSKSKNKNSNKRLFLYRNNITKNNMSSSHLAIFCVILIALFPLHEFVDGQGANAGFCVPVNCDTNDKNRSCATCHIASPRKTLSFKSLAECKAGCKA
ncbi:hypothetical protein YC2023_065076 [Brassica napus]